MTERQMSKWIPEGDQAAIELRLELRAGDVEAIRRLLRDDPALASARLGGRGGGSETALHVVAGWPGYYPNGPEIARLLIDGGADIEVPTGSIGSHS
jgi:uncharacterized protein